MATVPVPREYTQVELVSGRQSIQVYRAERNRERVALRIVRFPPSERGPVVDPAHLIGRLGEIVADMKLEAVPRLVHVERIDGGLAIAEAWVGDEKYFAKKRPLATIARDLMPVVRDLVALRDARKWHGGIRPTRFVTGPDGVRLVALPWASALSGMVRTLVAKLEPVAPLRAPELNATGPAAAGPSVDVYGLGATILEYAEPPLPAGARKLLEAARDKDPKARPTIADIRAALELIITKSLS